MDHKQHSDVPYRPDVDGLRAVAVLAVVIFHALPGGLPGGFIGVDVFFVISGYLIASIILGEQARGCFSLAGFYERRIRRIFPALFVVVAACAVTGAFLMTPADYAAFARSALAAVGFYSNLHFHRQAGYFTPAAETQPLLHTWSLGVEEQFYLIAPLLFIALAGRFARWRALVFWAIFLASLIVSAWGAFTTARWAFYLPHARAFELMCGMALAMGLAPRLASARANECLGAAGLLMILVAATTYNATTAFPGIAALLPAAGAALLIHSSTHTQRTAVARALSWAPIVYAGKISYSLYLWHWPLLAFAGYAWGADIDAGSRLALMGVAIALAALTHRYVEQPARLWRGSRAVVFGGGAAAIVICAAFSQVVVRGDGLPGRLSPLAASVAAATPSGPFDGGPCWREEARNRRATREICFIGDNAATTPTFALWGDSHAAMVAPALDVLARERGLKGYHSGDEGCPPLLGLAQASNAFRRCRGLDAQMRKILEDPTVTTVVLMARWARYAEGAGSPHEPDTRPRRFHENDDEKNREAFASLLKGTVDEIRRAGKSVVIIGPTPEFDVHTPGAMIKNAMRGRIDDIAAPRSAFDMRQRGVAPTLAELAKLQGVRTFFPHERLCDDILCRASANGVALYRDFDHLSAAGVDRVEAVLRAVISTVNGSSPHQP
jgi:peptidoglycan/LPS O-acetylase OafA/YrhL